MHMEQKSGVSFASYMFFSHRNISDILSVPYVFRLKVII